MTLIETLSYGKAVKDGKVTQKSGWHNPRKSGPFVRPRGCGCKTKPNNKGTYRDVSVEIDGKTLHYYHQTPVVIKKGTYVKLNSGGYFTSTTKERINRYIGKPFYVKQIDFEWYLINRNTGEKIPFVNGMVIKSDTNEVIES